MTHDKQETEGMNNSEKFNHVAIDLNRTKLASQTGFTENRTTSILHQGDFLLVFKRF